jgi:hypothetical protein
VIGVEKAQLKSVNNVNQKLEEFFMLKIVQSGIMIYQIFVMNVASLILGQKVKERRQ